MRLRKEEYFLQTVDEITKQIILEDIKDLPVRLTPKDIYNFYNKDGHIIGEQKAYDIAKKIGYRFVEGGRIYVNKTDFIKFLYTKEN